MRAAYYFSVITSFITVASILFGAHAASAQAQTGVELESVEALYQYGVQITFSARVITSVPLQQATIVITDAARDYTNVQPVSIGEDGRLLYLFDVKRNLLRPFSLIQWKYQFVLADGTTFESPAYSVRYEDNRFNWQRLTAGPLQVNWYNGDANFGQTALNAGQAGLQAISTLMPLDLTQPLDLYIYASSDDMRGTLVAGGEDWVAGHADPAMGVAMIVIPPGPDQNILMEQRIPHEIMHVMLYRRVGAGYVNLPAWLREGLATSAEVYRSPDYDLVLTDAAAKDALIPLKDLCIAFPTNDGQAFLAYAESRSFVSYLHQTYGSTGLMSLAGHYADGVDCERGPERAFGVSFSKLELDWRASALGQKSIGSALRNMTPYLVLLCLVLLVPLIGGLSMMRKKGKNEPETYA
ncbi:MAG: peptidase MA family metallohydrolase [Anaerolineales bacterium]